MQATKYEFLDSGTDRKGASGQVAKVRRIADSKVLACKRIRHTEYATREIFERVVGDEVQLLQRLIHPNIVRYFDKELDDEGAKIYTEFCDGENLEYFVLQKPLETRRPTDREIWSLIYQLSAALAYCHHGTIKGPGRHQFSEKIDNQGSPFKKVWHRDIKPRNVLVQHNSSGQLVFKLCDFGLSVSRASDSEQATLCGTPPYIAPEITNGRPKWSDKADIFSLGCTLYFFIAQFTPYSWQFEKREFADTRKSLPNGISTDISKLIYSCIEYEADDRPDSDKLFSIALEKVDENELPLSAINIADSIFQPPSTKHPKDSVKPMIPGNRGEAAQSRSLERRTIQSHHSVQATSGGDAADQILQPSLTENDRLPASTAEKRTSQILNRSEESIGVSRQGLSSPVLDRPRQTVDSSYSLRQGKGLSKATAPPTTVQLSQSEVPAPSIMSALSYQNSPATQYTLRGAGVMAPDKFEEHIYEKLGSFVVDYTRQEPLNSYRGSYYSPKDISGPVSVNEPVDFEDTYEVTTDKPPPRQRRFGILIGDRPARNSGMPDMSVAVRIKADASCERLLKNGEEYMREELRRNIGLHEWYTMQVNQYYRTVHVVVGCIVYENAFVEEVTKQEGRSRHDSHDLSTRLGVSIPVYAGETGNYPPRLQSNASRSNKIKRGLNIQGVSVQKIQQSKSGHKLGEVETVFFWGPKRLP